MGSQEFLKPSGALMTSGVPGASFAGSESFICISGVHKVFKGVSDGLKRGSRGFQGIPRGLRGFQGISGSS